MYSKIDHEDCHKPSIAIQGQLTQDLATKFMIRVDQVRLDLHLRRSNCSASWALAGFPIGMPFHGR